jgi:ATP-dependent protease Clp ATPase subunit
MQKRTFFGVPIPLGKGEIFSPAQPLEPTCSFCGRADHRLTLVASDGETPVSICDECVSLCLTLIRQADRESFDRIVAAAYADTRTTAVLTPIEGYREVRCNFCGSMRSTQGRVIAGPTIFICHECVGLSLYDIRGRDRELFDRITTSA